ncbi:MAG: hypothetical protein AAF501_17580 [Pseudomonadota bacterium]
MVFGDDLEVCVPRDVIGIMRAPGQTPQEHPKCAILAGNPAFDVTRGLGQSHSVASHKIHCEWLGSAVAHAIM